MQSYITLVRNCVCIHSYLTSSNVFLGSFSIPTGLLWVKPLLRVAKYSPVRCDCHVVLCRECLWLPWFHIFTILHVKYICVYGDVYSNSIIWTSRSSNTRDFMDWFCHEIVARYSSHYFWTKISPSSPYLCVMMSYQLNELVKIYPSVPFTFNFKLWKNGTPCSWNTSTALYHGHSEVMGVPSYVQWEHNLSVRVHMQSHSLVACQQTAAQSSVPAWYNGYHTHTYAHMHMHTNTHNTTSSCQGTLDMVRLDALEFPQ